MHTLTFSFVVAAATMVLSPAGFATPSHGHGGTPSHPVCTQPADCETTLNFSKLIAVRSKLEYSDVVGGGDLVITPNKGKLAIVLGELGVASGKFPSNLDVRLGSGEAINFLFQNDVTLKGWDLDDLPFGTNKFSLSVDGGAAQLFSLDSHTADPGALLSGKSFTFGYSGDSYLIDSVKFICLDVPIGPVPEPQGVALSLAGLLVLVLGGVSPRHAGKR